MVLPGEKLRMFYRLTGKFLLGLILTTLLSACSLRSSSDLKDENVFRPPTQAVSPTPVPATPLVLSTSTPIAVDFHPTATPVCIDSLTFIADLTIPDGMLVNPGAVLDKRWQVTNSGTCNWDEGYTIQRTAGPELGAPQNLALYPARSGGEAILRIEFIAPAEAGTFRSAWQAYSPVGIAFGDPFYIEFTVSP